jgi:hypothetical protein
MATMFGIASGAWVAGMAVVVAAAIGGCGTTAARPDAPQEGAKLTAADIRLDTKIAMQMDVFLVDEGTQAAMKKQLSAQGPAGEISLLTCRTGTAAVLSPAGSAALAAKVAGGADTIHLNGSALTLMNWEPGFVALTQQRNVVDGWNRPATPDASPTMHVATLETGLKLEIQPVIHVKPQPSTLLRVALTLRQLQGVDTVGALDVPGISTFLVQIPRVAETKVAQVVDTGNGRTLLLGGERIVGDVMTAGGKVVHLKTPHYLYTTVTPTILAGEESGTPVSMAAR